MEIKASAKYLRISPRKVRELTVGWRGLPAEQVLAKLPFYPQKGTAFLIKLLKQALANAKNNFQLASHDLLVKKIEVSEGAGFKRLDKSHGARFDRGMIKKRTAHIFLTLEERRTKGSVGADLVSARVGAIHESPVEVEAGRGLPAKIIKRRVNGTKG